MDPPEVKTIGWGERGKDEFSKGTSAESRTLPEREGYYNVIGSDSITSKRAQKGKGEAWR